MISLKKAKTMREIKYIFLHCTASTQSWTVAGLLSFFKNVKKWKAPGYHYVITPDGELHNIFPEEKIANGVAGQNSVSIHISYFGGILPDGTPVDNRTIPQRKTMSNIVTSLLEKYPSAKLAGHNQFAAKACPSFDVPLWAKSIGIPAKRIYKKK